MTDPTTENLTIVESPEETRPDALLIISRVTELTPTAGHVAKVTVETGRLARHGDTVLLVLIAVAPMLGEILVRPYADADAAAVEFANTADALRRDGWTVREPEAWDVPDPLASDAPIPF